MLIGQLAKVKAHRNPLPFGTIFHILSVKQDHIRTSKVTELTGDLMGTKMLMSMKLVILLLVDMHRKQFSLCVSKSKNRTV